MDALTLAAIHEHAVAEYPRECCGLVVAIEGRETYVPCRNEAAAPSEHFRLPAEDYASAEDRGEVLALVHSHPNAPATPSDADRVQCEGSGLVWHIVSVGQVDGAAECGDIQTIEPSGYEAPLIGRQFAHGILDCYTLVQDFYRRELGIQLSNYTREDDWWLKGQQLYSLDRLQAEGFERITDAPRRGDLILMQIRSTVPNHAGIYLGDGVMLHHLHSRLSDRVVYGGYWAERTCYIVRHREMIDG
ncbi:C40 family peptidase [Stenotrophomonas sp. HITSZ_GD]|uniref:C40 family peptidase n=1 Tax=Stenotrophomonas sp. HITSZ_GD TaxID=3037248 RepID=UPI00240DE453|nr:C40 family peptidase [Stenotrophomonas sp. HITSZ_GD]MDG2524656.1 C40 family peptidase [Stenotrophomonas sp. HITSZ_GD]